MGKLIVLEGGDGSGKTTQCELIKQYFEKENITYKFSHFLMYGDNEFSEVIAKFLRGEFGKSDKVDPYFVANIYAMDQFLFKPKLIKYLDEYDVVLLDRYVYSNIAYQGSKYSYQSKESKEIMIWIERFQFDFLSMPKADLILFLNVPVEILKERLVDRRKTESREYLQGKEDIHEVDFELQKRVVDNYTTYFKRKKNIINADFHIIESASLSGDFDNGDWRLHAPENIFESYKPFITDIISKNRLNINYTIVYDEDAEVESSCNDGLMNSI